MQGVKMLESNPQPRGMAVIRSKYTILNLYVGSWHCGGVKMCHTGICRPKTKVLISRMSKSALGVLTCFCIKFAILTIILGPDMQGDKMFESNPQPTGMAPSDRCNQANALTTTQNPHPHMGLAFVIEVNVCRVSKCAILVLLGVKTCHTGTCRNKGCHTEHYLLSWHVGC